MLCLSGFELYSRWVPLFPRVSFMKSSCLRTKEFHIEWRQKTEHWMKQNFAEVSQKVINLFVSLCRLHAEHKPITSRVKEVTKPLQATSFLSMLEIDLMDFQNLPCTCRNPHKWVIDLIDHHAKFVNTFPTRKISR